MGKVIASALRGYLMSLFVSGTTAAVEDHAGAIDGGSLELSGEALYVEYCAVCHGSDARGDGPLAAMLSIKPPNLRRLSVLAGAQFPADRVRRHIDGRELSAAHGSREMPVWGSVFKRARGSYGERRVGERLGKLIEYLRGIQDME